MHSKRPDTPLESKPQIGNVDTINTVFILRLAASARRWRPCFRGPVATRQQTPVGQLYVRKQHVCSQTDDNAEVYGGEPSVIQLAAREIFEPRWKQTGHEIPPLRLGSENLQGVSCRHACSILLKRQ